MPLYRECRLPSLDLRKRFDACCVKNKYARWYWSIIARAYARGWTSKTKPCYVEWHHAVPRSFEENNDLISLTAREHFVAHLCLVRMTTGPTKYVMAQAVWRMVNTTKYGRIKSRTYAGIKSARRGWSQTPEWKEKRLAKIRGLKRSESTKMLMRQNRPHGPNGKKWFNDGISECSFVPGSEPSGWVRGRLPGFRVGQAKRLDYVSTH